MHTQIIECCSEKAWNLLCAKVDVYTIEVVVVVVINLTINHNHDHDCITMFAPGLVNCANVTVDQKQVETNINHVLLVTNSS